MSDFPTTTPYKAATALACEIAGVNADRFNEAVHAGHYPCAPRTTPGKARSFDVNDIITLRLYQRFLDAGMGAKAAGAKACDIRRFLVEHPQAEQVYVVQPSIGTPHYFDYFDTRERHGPYEGAGALDIVSVEVWNLYYLRGRIVHEINEHAMTIGREI